MRTHGAICIRMQILHICKICTRMQIAPCVQTLSQGKSTDKSIMYYSNKTFLVCSEVPGVGMFEVS